MFLSHPGLLLGAMNSQYLNFMFFIIVEPFLWLFVHISLPFPTPRYTFLFTYWIQFIRFQLLLLFFLRQAVYSPDWPEISLCRPSWVWTHIHLPLSPHSAKTKGMSHHTGVLNWIKNDRILFCMCFVRVCISSWGSSASWLAYCR